MYTLEQIYEALGKIENGGTDGALKNLIATLTALQNAGGALSTLDTQMNGLKFQSTLLMRGATSTSPPLCVRLKKFQSTLLMRGATDAYGKGPGWYAISIHAPHARSDLTIHSRRRSGSKNFNPRSSCEERLSRVFRSPKGQISIHAPHARSDPRTTPDAPSGSWHFNPRSSCEERRLDAQYAMTLSKFQSTLLMRGATRAARLALYDDVFQSTLLMRGATLRYLRFVPVSQISIHAPHARSDCFVMICIFHVIISIHAPHARSDICFVMSSGVTLEFQSTLLMRGATQSGLPGYFLRSYFNPRSSCEERPAAPS